MVPLTGMVIAVTAALAFGVAGLSRANQWELLDNYEPGEVVGPGFPDPARSDCKGGGWSDPLYQGEFANQGACIRFANESARANP
jgi:hypothetical protein